MAKLTEEERAQRQERIRAEVATWPPLSQDDLDAIAAALCPGWVLADRRALPPDQR